MSKPISLFSGYSQRENRTTNYCLLILKMLYEENPKFLREVMSSLVSVSLGEQIGVEFRQQENRESSVPDGRIFQSAFTIYIETKHWDWFYDEQLENHLDGLNRERPGLKILIALSSFDNDNDEKFSKIRQLCAEKYKGSIEFSKVSFKDLLDALDISHLPKNLKDTIAEFRDYLHEQGLLQSRERWLDVVNCAGIPDDVLVRNVYMCPATSGAYTHYPCKYFGMYRNKCIEKVALIEAVIDVKSAESATIVFQNVGETKEELKRRALVKVEQIRPGIFPTRVFLLGPLFDTNCTKDTPGGMYNSKQYFDIGSLNAEGAEKLANALSGKTWSEIKSLRYGRSG